MAAELEQGRRRYEQGAWADAYESLTVADRASPLVAEDLVLLATSAYMLGREQEYWELLERAYRGHLEAAEPLAAARCAFWIGVTLALQGEVGRAGGWHGRAKRLLDREGTDCVERGYLLISRVVEHRADGELERAAAAAAEAAAVGERFGDPDLVSMGSFLEGAR